MVTMGTSTGTMVKFLLIITVINLAVSGASGLAPDIDVLKSITLNDSPVRQLPLAKHDHTTNVSINVLVAAINLNLNKMQADINFYLRQRWEDPRLNYTSLRSTNETLDGESWEVPYRHLRSDWYNYIWTPDIFIPNAVSSNKFDYPSSTASAILYANGTVISDIRMKALVNCPVDQYKFLHDSQYCRLQFESFSYTNERLKLQWYKHIPVDYDDKIKLQQTVTKVADSDLQDCTTQRFTAVHSCLQVVLTLQRTNNIYVTQVYFPSTLTVFLSWLSFWIDREAILARVSLGSLCVVTIMTHATGLLSRLPEQAGIKAIDVWELACVTLIFCAMLEFAAMHAMLRRQQKIKAAKKFVEEYNARNSKNEILVNNDINEIHITEGDPCTPNGEQKVVEKRIEAKKVLRPRWWQMEPVKIDIIARRLFPVVFVGFNIVYWSYYTR